MLLLLYKIFIAAYGLGVRVAATWNPKAKEWVRGRKKLFEELHEKIPPSARFIWMHCASAGEFEQGKPLIGKLKKIYPDHQVLVSFYSPSGFSSGKKYKEADLICYLPEDTASNALEFLRIVKPSLAIFVKYDFWYYHLKAVADNNIPLILVSSIFRKEQPFFKWYGGLHRKILSFFSRIFVQDDQSKQLLAGINIGQVTVAGDTRFDRVADIADAAKEFPILNAFAKEEHVLVAGSTWPDDELLISRNTLNSHKYKLVIAPHEISEKSIGRLFKMFPNAVRYSDANAETIAERRVLIIDNYGMLSSLYRYADFAYIGGGFNTSGIHNILEAAVWGCPVIFGPNYQKFREAKEMVELEAAFSVKTTSEFESVIENFVLNDQYLEEKGRKAADYVKDNTGAVKGIVDYIQENRLLTT